MPNTLSAIILVILILFGSGCSRFYVKVIDQHGEPVPDVSARISVFKNFILVVGSESDYYITDDNGRITLVTSRSGVGLIQKNGYEFQYGAGFGSASIETNYRKGDNNSYSNPYYILAWKREEPEPLIGTEPGGSFGIESSDKYFDIYFEDLERRAERRSIPNFDTVENTDAILLIHYKIFEDVDIPNTTYEHRHPWEMKLIVPQGGLIETDDIIRNLAPDKGYQQTWTLRSTDFSTPIYSVNKHFYLTAKNGQVYGQFTIDFKPTRDSFSFPSYWLNMNGSRNLTRSKKYVYCNNKYLPRDCSLDDYGP